MKNNIKVKQFWDTVYFKSINNGLWDQPIVNEILYDNLIYKTDVESSYKDNNKIIWHTFGSAVWNWSMKNTRPFVQPQADIVLHHANCTIKLEDKIKQLNDVYETLIQDARKNNKYDIAKSFSIFDRVSSFNFLEHATIIPNIISTEYFNT